MAEQKTKPTHDSVNAFLDAIVDAKRREDCFTILKLMQKITKHPPKMWGSSMVGFGEVHYRYASGYEGDTFLLGFSPRKSALTLYLGANLDLYREQLERLGKHKTGKGCLYIRSLSDVDLAVLTALFKKAATQSI